MEYYGRWEGALEVMSPKPALKAGIGLAVRVRTRSDSGLSLHQGLRLHQTAHNSDSCTHCTQLLVHVGVCMLCLSSAHLLGTWLY